MSLTLAQQVALKAYVQADPVLSIKTPNSDGALDIANALNQPDPSGYQVWRSSTETGAILDAITWANLTPAGVSDGSAIALQNEYKCQGRQLNLQIMLQGRESLGTGRLTTRQGLQDALQNVPSGAGGALLDAGWIGAGKVKASITRPATVLEKLFATGAGTAANPSTMAVESPIDYPTVSTAMGWG